MIVRQLGSQIDAVAGKPKFPLYKATYSKKGNCEEKYTFLRSKGNSERKELESCDGAVAGRET